MKKGFSLTFKILLAGSILALSACQTIPLNAGPTPTAKAPQDRILTPLWMFQTGAAIWGSPAIEGGVAYIGSDDGNLYAVSTKNGQLVWKFATKGIVRSKPALADGLVYITSDDGFLYALTAKNGQLAWSADIGNQLDRQKRVDLGTSPSSMGFDYIQSSPVVVGSLVYAGSLDGNVYALSYKDGQLVWKFKTGAKVRASPTLDNGTLYIGSWDRNFYALDAKSGAMRWKTDLKGQVQSNALVDDGQVYCASREASVYALDSQTGAVKWRYLVGVNMWVESSPILVDGMIYVGSSGSQAVYGLKSESGVIGAMFNSHAFHWSTPLQLNHTIYIGGVGFQSLQDGGLYALNVVNRRLPAFKADARLLSTQTTLEFSGDWSGVAGSPSQADGVIYYGALDGNLYAVKDE